MKTNVVKNVITCQQNSEFYKFIYYLFI